jgi:hypothetical protein
MTQLCYTLDEAARKLDMSETVLVRLSQFFKVPEASYEESGYLSFKGDLAFTDEDMRFFSAVKERILAGESLDSIKARVKSDLVAVKQNKTLLPAVDLPVNQPEETRSFNSSLTGSAPQSFSAAQSLAEMTVSTSIPTMPSPEPMREAAERNFNRYKTENRGPGKVFRNLMKKIDITQDASESPQGKITPPRVSRPDRTSLIGLHAMSKNQEEPKPYYDDTETALNPTMASLRQPIQFFDDVGENSPWVSLVEEAERNRRAMDARLKTAALMLKERALSHQAIPQDSQRNKRKAPG